jgi:hypothetical protein
MQARTIGLGTHILLANAVPDLPADKKAPPDTGESGCGVCQGYRRA